MTQPNPRIPEAKVDEIFLKRWSTRGFSSEPLRTEEINSLFEAARWAPSSFNLQPWLFLYATDGEEREQFNSILVPQNKAWAYRAPLLAFVCAQRVSESNDTIYTAHFDSGAAWMSLAIQAAKMGLWTHAMAGIDREAAHRELKVPREKYDVVCALVAGRQDASVLSGELLELDRPSSRNSLKQIAIKGLFSE